MNSYKYYDVISNIQKALEKLKGKKIKGFSFKRRFRIQFSAYSILEEKRKA